MEQKRKSRNGGVVVSWDIDETTGNTTVIIGRKTKSGVLQVINALQGEDAKKVLDVLMLKPEEDHKK